MLQALAGAGDLTLGVVSNKRGPLLLLEAARLGWDRYFGCLVGAIDAERDKPAPAGVDFALSGSGIAAGPADGIERNRAVEGESVSCRVDLGGSRPIKKQTPPHHHYLYL